MAKISAYGNYSENVPSGGTTAKFKETGVIPVSGKYTETGDMETKNVLMSELLGGLPEIGSNDNGKVLTVDTDHAVWAEPSGGKEYQGMAPISITGYSTPTVELNYVTDDFDIDQSQNPPQLKLVRPVPAPNDDHSDQGKVLTVNNSDEIVWAPAPSGLPQLPSDYTSKDYFLHINQSSGTIEWAEIPAAGS